MIQPGIYEAKIQNYGIQKTKKEQPEPVIEFVANDSAGVPQRVFWRGSLNNEVGVEIALKALIACGLQDASVAWKLAKGPASGLLDQQKTLRITVVHETYEGKTYARVKWINDPAEADARASERMVDENEAAQLFRTIDLRAKFNELKGPAQAYKKAVGAESLDDTPF